MLRNLGWYIWIGERGGSKGEVRIPKGYIERGKGKEKGRGVGKGNEEGKGEEEGEG